MRFVSLIDTGGQKTITIDADAQILRLELDGSVHETRLKAYAADVLYMLFNKHPQPLKYDEIIDVFKAHKLILTDVTRMHRKLSEIRIFLQTFHPSLGDMLLNTRSVGYSLPLRLKNIHHLECTSNITFKNANITTHMLVLRGLVDDAISLTSQRSVIRHVQGYVIDRDPIRALLIEKITLFNQASDGILREIRVAEADFTGIRVQYLLAKLRTYVGMTRISEYPISEVQWLDWFTQEVWMLFDDLQKLVKKAGG
jgi:hypothetical protein